MSNLLVSQETIVGDLRLAASIRPLNHIIEARRPLGVKL